MKKPNTVRESRKTRKGAIAALTALLLMAILGLVACALDIGWIEMTRTQLQSVSDASCLAAGTELMPGLGYFKTKTPAQIVDAATPVAVEYAGYNRNAELASTYIDGDRDVEFGKATFEPLEGGGCGCWKKTPASENPEYYNYVAVAALRNQVGSTAGDGPAPLFFARILGMGEKSLKAGGTAAILAANGFRVVEEDDTANVMPFAFMDVLWDRMQRAQKYLDEHPGLNLTNWNTLQSIEDTPSYTGDNTANYPGEPLFGARSGSTRVQLLFDGFRRTEAGAVSSGADGQLEVNIYPRDVNIAGNSASNHGTVDFGSGSNSTSELSRKIRTGLNADDLSHYENNEIVLTEDDPLDDGGNPGMSNGMSSALNDVVGQCKAIALYDTFSGNGNNGVYTLVRFVSGTVVRVQLNGNQNNREVRLQRCVLVDNSAVPDEENEIDDTTTIFTPLTLIR